LPESFSMNIPQTGLACRWDEFIAAFCSPDEGLSLAPTVVFAVRWPSYCTASCWITTYAAQRIAYRSVSSEIRRRNCAALAW